MGMEMALVIMLVCICCGWAVISWLDWPVADDDSEQGRRR
jgi:hypothetical protein